MTHFVFLRQESYPQKLFVPTAVMPCLVLCHFIFKSPLLLNFVPFNSVSAHCYPTSFEILFHYHFWWHIPYILKPRREWWIRSWWWIRNCPCWAHCRQVVACQSSYLVLVCIHVASLLPFCLSTRHLFLHWIVICTAPLGILHFIIMHVHWHTLSPCK